MYPGDRLPPRIESTRAICQREFGPINGIDVRRFRVKSDDVRLLIVRHRKYESGGGEGIGSEKFRLRFCFEYQLNRNYSAEIAPDSSCKHNFDRGQLYSNRYNLKQTTCRSASPSPLPELPSPCPSEILIKRVKYRMRNVIGTRSLDKFKLQHAGWKNVVCISRLNWGSRIAPRIARMFMHLHAIHNSIFRSIFPSTSIIEYEKRGKEERYRYQTTSITICADLRFSRNTAKDEETFE